MINMEGACLGNNLNGKFELSCHLLRYTIRQLIRVNELGT
jgi:hypothetical protein